MSDLLLDFAVHSRYLVAVPLFIVAESFTLASLGKTAHHFVEADLVCALDRPRFERITASRRLLLHSKIAEIVVILLAYFTVIVLLRVISPETVPPWHTLAKGHLSFTWAGWWHALVSIPVALILLLGWLWRLFL